MKRQLVTFGLLFLTILSFGQETKYVNTEQLNIRSGAGSSFEVVDKASQGTKVIVISNEGKWSKIELENGTKGYVFTNYLSSDYKNDSKKNDKNNLGSILIILGVLGYAIYKIKNFFSGLFSKNSSNSSTSRSITKVATLKWYHCGVCGTLVKQTSTPTNTNRSCNNKDYHKWKELGKIGNLNYQCKRCGIVVQTTSTPTNNTNWSCLGNDYHKWIKL
jgi:uncharacterized protein YgiM (DUF1202 family)